MNLTTMTREELVTVAKDLNIKVHHNAKPETIIMQINQQPKAYVRDAMEHKAATPVEPIHNNTPEMVRETIEAQLHKEGFTAEFPGDGTWIFKCKNKTESGNLAIPLRIIKMKAESVATPGRGPKQIKFDGEVMLGA